MPGVLYGAEHALGVRHHDGDATVAGGQAGNAARRAVGVGRIAFGHAATVVDVTQSNRVGGLTGVNSGAAGKLGVAFTVGDSNPVTVALNNVVNTSTGVKEYNVDMAAAIIAALPTLAVYVIAGTYFVRGLAAGAVKG